MVIRIKGMGAMENIVLYNSNGQRFEVEVVRYFKQDNCNYLIFSLNEYVENGYIQLYASKIIENFGKVFIENIIDDNEWHNFKDTIQKIVINNRNGIQNTGDLDYHHLDGQIINGFRIFKLKAEVARILSENKKTDQKEKIITPVEDAPSLEAASAQDTGLSIEEILKQVSDGAKNAREVSKVDLNEDKPQRKTLDDLLNSSNSDNTIREVSITHIPEIDEEKNSYEEPHIMPKIIPAQDFRAPFDVASSSIDYKSKYEESLEKIHRLENENIRLINELVEAKAKVETIRDIIN